MQELFKEIWNWKTKTNYELFLHEIDHIMGKLVYRQSLFVWQLDIDGVGDMKMSSKLMFGQLIHSVIHPRALKSRSFCPTMLWLSTYESNPSSVHDTYAAKAQTDQHEDILAEQIIREAFPHNRKSHNLDKLQPIETCWASYLKNHPKVPY